MTLSDGYLLASITASTASVIGVIVMIAMQVLNRLELGRSRREQRKAAAAAAEQVQEVAETLVSANTRVAQAAAATRGQLKEIHTLVNSNLTEAKQAERDATIREVAMMKEVIALKEASGIEPSLETLHAVAVAQERISELNAILADRSHYATTGG